MWPALRHNDKRRQDEQQAAGIFLMEYDYKKKDLEKYGYNLYKGSTMSQDVMYNSRCFTKSKSHLQQEVAP